MQTDRANLDAAVARWLRDKHRIVHEQDRGLRVVLQLDFVAHAEADFHAVFTDGLDGDVVGGGAGETPDEAFEAGWTEYLYQLGEAEAVRQTYDAMRGRPGV